jgi:hypothetical protein
MRLKSPKPLRLACRQTREGNTVNLMVPPTSHLTQSKENVRKISPVVCKTLEIVRIPLLTKLSRYSLLLQQSVADLVDSALIG